MWIEPYADELNTTQLDLVFAYRSTGHFGAYHSADYAHVQARLPFYLRDVFTSVFSTNHRYRENHRLMRHAIERVHPRAAAVTTTKGGPAQPWRITNVHRFAPYYGTLARKAVNKVSQKAGVPILPTVAHFDPAPLAGRRAVLRSLGQGRPPRVEDLRCSALFDGRALQEFLDRAAQDERFNSVMLGRILTVELALRAVGNVADGGRRAPLSRGRDETDMRPRRICLFVPGEGIEPSRPHGEPAGLSRLRLPFRHPGLA